MVVRVLDMFNSYHRTNLRCPYCKKRMVSEKERLVYDGNTTYFCKGRKHVFESSPWERNRYYYEDKRSTDSAPWKIVIKYVENPDTHILTEIEREVVT